MKIKAFIFDLDGVLTDTAEYHYQAWQRLADEEGIPFSREENENLRGISRRESLEYMLSRDAREATEEQIQAMMARKNRYYRELIRSMGPSDLLPGAAELLTEIRQAGIRIAVASVSKNARDVISSLRLGPLVDAISDGYSVEHHKPAPDLFLHAARQLGVPPANCIVVEDAASGIEAARSAGMWSVGLGPAERVGKADLTFPSLEGVRLSDILDGLKASAAASGDDLWLVRELAFDPARQHHKETVFAVGNGYLGTRGTFEEGYPNDRQATLINGVFDDAPVVHTELANAPDWLSFHLIVDGQQFSMDCGDVLAYERALDMHRGLLRRTVRWRSPGGHTFDLDIERWASLADAHICAIRYGVTSVDFEGPVEFRAGLNGMVDNDGLTHWYPVAQGSPDARSCYLHARTRHTPRIFLQ